MTTPVTLIRSSALAPAPYAHAASVPPGVRLVLLAGACPLDADGATIGVGDYAAQAAACVENLATALGAAGASLENVAQTRVLVASSVRADLVTAWEVVRGAFADHEVPSTLVGVTVLGYADQLVELEAVAAVADV